MERKRAMASALPLWFLFAGLLSQNLIFPVSANGHEQDQKTYYPSPDPVSGTPPSGHGESPPSHHHHHGGSPPKSGGNCPTPSTPHHGSPPSHHGRPPSYGGSPPVVVTPPTPIVDPGTPSGGGGYYSPPTPSGGGGSYTPPSIGGGSPPVVVTPPTPMVDPGTPGGSGGGYYSPPSTPVDPGTTPTVPTPGTPFLPLPFPGTCDYWRTHPSMIWGMLGWWGNLGSMLGMPSLPGANPTSSLLEALSNQRTDGFSSLYREGTASFLNSMVVNNRFPYTTKQVRDGFAAGLSSNKAAASQAKLFKMANEGRIKPRA